MINSVSEHGGDCVRPRSMGCISSISEHGDNGKAPPALRRRRSGQPKRSQSIHALKIPKSSDHSIIEKYGIPKESDHSHRGKCSMPRSNNDDDEVVVVLKKKRSSNPKKTSTSAVISPGSSSSEEDLKSPTRKKPRGTTVSPKNFKTTDAIKSKELNSLDKMMSKDKRRAVIRTDSSSGSSFAFSLDDSIEEEEPEPEKNNKPLTAWQKREQFKKHSPPRPVAQRSRSITISMNSTDDEDEGMAANVFPAKKRHSAPLPVHQEEEDETRINSKPGERRSSTKPAWKLREEARKKAIAKLRGDKVDDDTRTAEQMRKYLKLDDKKSQMDDDDDYDDLDTPSFHESSELYFDY